MAGQARAENRIAPVVVIGMRRRARHLPACQRCAWLSFCAIAQHDYRHAAFSRRESQTAAGHQIQAFGHAFHFQQQHAHMRTRQNVAGRRKSIGGVTGSYRNQLARIAAQFRKSVGRERAIFHGLIIGPDPKERPLACGQQCEQHGKTAGAPALCKDFVQRAGSQAAAQHRIRLWMTQCHSWSVRRQAIVRQRKAQFRQFCSFVHDMFHNARTISGVNRGTLIILGAYQACCAATGSVFTCRVILRIGRFLGFL